MTKKPLKRIAAITMARNDEFFLSRWIKYYGDAIGTENLYIYLDGTDQITPENAGAAHITKLPHTDMSRAAGDKYRIGLMSDLAKKLLAEYDIVIGCDCDEFLIVDPDLNVGLAEYLSNKKINTTLSGLGLDVGQHMTYEEPLDTTQPFLAQRKYAFISTRYTKPVVLNKPVSWGSGFHRVKNHNFHIDKNLYLLHFGAVDMDMLIAKAAKRGEDWVNHLKRRGNGTINDVTNRPARGERWVKISRAMQRFIRAPYAWNKPNMCGIKIVVKIPERFKKSGV
ncbi:MAG: glycosyltransferase family 2 protein [Alphaproteobacteria bacterium]|nr:glycosyltransferase family 2 protein [Alphaproteobacteria bacterium]MBQ8729435.1 glycosyltransferase family 2 protein [Alphaproteobacteria bacterium]